MERIAKKGETIICILIIGFAFNSCSSLLCGGLPPNLKTRVENAQARFFDKVEIEPIPCEMRYINVYLKSKQIDSSLISDVHSMLYDEKAHSGWVSIFVFNKDKEYLTQVVT
jgi:hypothetical protein